MKIFLLSFLSLLSLVVSASSVQAADAKTDLVRDIIRGAKRALLSDCLDNATFLKAKKTAQRFLWEQVDAYQELIGTVYQNGPTELSKKWLPLVGNSFAGSIDLYKTVIPPAIDFCNRKDNRATEALFEIAATWLKHAQVFTEYLRTEAADGASRIKNKKKAKKAIKEERQALKLVVKTRAESLCGIKTLLSEVSPTLLELIGGTFLTGVKELQELVKLLPKKDRKLPKCLTK